MESNNTKKEFRNVAIRFGVIFFLVLLVLTFYSKTVEQMLLPEVSVYLPEQEDIKSEYNFFGTVTYDKTYNEYPVFSYYIEEVLIKKDSVLLIGKPIAKLRAYDVEKAREDYDIRILKLKDTISGYDTAIENGLRKSQRESTERKLEIAKAELKNLEKEKILYFKYIDDDNNLLCNVKGRVTNMYMKDCRHINISDPMFEYVNKSSNPIIEWEMSVEKTAIYDKSSRVRLDYNVLAQDNFGNYITKTKTLDFDIDNIEFDSDKNNYIYSIKLPETQNLLTSHKINVLLTSRPIRLKNAIPKSAVKQDDSGNDIIYVVREDYETGMLIVKETHIKIKGDYETHYDIDYSFGYKDSVVISSTKGLSHNMRVKLR